MEVIICTINLVLISSAYVIAAYLMLEDSGIVYLKDFIQAIIACYPLLLVSASVAHCFYFIFDDERSAIATWAIIIILIPELVAMAGLKISILGKLSEWLPWNILGNATFDIGTHRIIMEWSSQSGFIKCFIEIGRASCRERV